MQRQDRAGFDEFVQARSGALARTAYLLTGDTHLAEDLVQVALLATATHWHKISTSPEAYARKAMYHQNISWWRKRPHRELPLEDRLPSPGDDLALRQSLLAALRQLTQKQRTVLVLRYFEDLTEAQTAQTLNISVGAVKSMTRQALNRLRTLAPHLGELLESGDLQ
jgi:RNA polymerase sigma-70 factor (sigma-E family)